MPISYPTSLDSLANPTSSTYTDDSGFELDAVISTLNDIAEALEAKLGIGSSTPTTAGDVAYVTGSGASAWGPRSAIRLAETTLTTGTASIAFSNIPATYRHLLLIGLARDTGTGTTGTLDLLVNVLGTFDNQNLTGAGATAAAAEGLAGGRLLAGEVTGGGAAAALFAPSVIFVPDYAGTSHDKCVLSLSGNKVGTATGNVGVAVRAGWGRSGTAAVTSLTLSATSGSNLAAGTRFTLYGLPT